MNEPEEKRQKRAFAACARLSLALVPLLAGCGDQEAPAVDPTASLNASGDAIVTEILDKQMMSRATGAMTTIDAATGDASAMPEDSNEAISVGATGPANESITSALPPPAAPLRPEEGDLLPSIAE